MSSRVQKKIANAEQTTKMLVTMQRVANRAFYLKNGIWTEKGIDNQKADVEIEFLSNAYFDLLQKDKQIKDILAVGEKIIFQWEGKVYKIADTK
jgi:hypothetical protein